MNEATRLRCREIMKRWFAEHPNYPKVHLANQQKLQEELGTALNGTIPVKASKKITYVVNVRNPLKPDERVQRDIPNRKRKRNGSINQSPEEEEFIPCDTQ